MDRLLANKGFRAWLLVVAFVVAVIGAGAPTASAEATAGYGYDESVAEVWPGDVQEDRCQESQSIVGAASSPDGAVARAKLARSASTTSSPTFVAPNRAPGLADDFTDHVVLGKSNGLPANAEKLGGRHLMGSADWQADVLGAISNPNTRISVALDGLEGAGTAHSRVMAAIQRASSGRGSPLDWELMQLHQGGRLSTTGFYEGGNAITNPFG